MADTPEQSLRRTAREIFEHVENNAHEELRRSTQALAFSRVCRRAIDGSDGIERFGRTGSL